MPIKDILQLFTLDSPVINALGLIMLLMAVGSVIFTPILAAIKFFQKNKQDTFDDCNKKLKECEKDLKCMTDKYYESREDKIKIMQEQLRQ